jgi:DNA primase
MLWRLLFLANLIPEATISDIKQAADIVDVVSQVVVLRKAGRNFVGLCPFHSEKTPSFTVSPDKQIFHCFGCGTGGNVFTFVMRQESLSFPEAVRMLAGRYGIEIPRPAEQARGVSEKERLLEVNQQAMVFFQQTLVKNPVGQRPLQYLKRRGLSEETVRRFCLGYAPKSWDGLLRHFARKSISLELVEKAGLIVARKEANGYYDRFRDRVIFPILSVNQQVIAFGGRVLDDSLPKYLNSPETPVYQKSRTLYGLNLAKDHCKSSDAVYIVEGYLDLLALHQHGIQNAVASLGTALTADHVRLLARYASRMVLVYDSDEAGIRSAQRCIDIFWREHVNFKRGDVFKDEKADTRILVLPQGHDPDSFLNEFGAEKFLAAAVQAPGMITFMIDCAVRKHGLSIEGKLRIFADMQAALAAVDDSVARALYIKQLSERLEIPENAVLDRIREISGKIDVEGRNVPDTAGSRNSVDKSKPGTPKGTGSRLERQIIAMMLQYPQMLAEIDQRRVLDYFANETLQSIGKTILTSGYSGPQQLSSLLDAIGDAEVRQLVTALAMSEDEDSWNRAGCMRLIAKFVETGQRTRSRKTLDEQIKAAEETKDQALLLKLLGEKQKLAVRTEKQKKALMRVDAPDN